MTFPARLTELIEKATPQYAPYVFDGKIVGWVLVNPECLREALAKLEEA